MLVLSRHRDESIIIGNDITVTIVDIRGDKVRLGVEAPNDVPVHRFEVYEAIRRNSPPGRWLGPAPELETELDSIPDSTPTTDQQAEINLDQLRQEIARLQTDRANLIHDHQNELSLLQAQNSQLQDEVNDLLDCKEQLRNLGQELCGCDHVESRDERATQTAHILEAFGNLHNQIQQIRDSISNPVIALCAKHQVVHTNGCYICKAEQSK